MENRINLRMSVNPYLQRFTLAQVNFSTLIQEERLRKKLEKSRKRETSANA